MYGATPYTTNLIALKRKFNCYNRFLIKSQTCFYIWSAHETNASSLVTRDIKAAASCKSDQHLSLLHSFHVAKCVIARMQLTFSAFPTLLHLRKRRSALCAIPGSPTTRAHTRSPATELRML